MQSSSTKDLNWVLQETIAEASFNVVGLAGKSNFFKSVLVYDMCTEWAAIQE